MRKLIKSVGLIAIIFMLFAVNFCTKDITVSNDNNTAIQKVNPFVSPEAMLPFQYVIYENDKDMLFEYIQLKLDSMVDEGEEGYFILSYSADNTHISYGFITETSSYYDPNIWIYPDTIAPNSNNGGGMCFAWVPIKDGTFSSALAAAQCAADQVEGTSCVATISYDKKTKTYFVVISMWDGHGSWYFPPRN